MKIFNSHYILITIISILLFSYSTLLGGNIRNSGISINLLIGNDALILNPFNEFSFSFEIINNSDKPITINSADDIIISLSSQNRCIYKRSVKVPVTAKAKLNSMRVKRPPEPVKPVLIESGEKKLFEFNSLNTLPLIKDESVDLQVSVKTSDTSIVQSDTVTFTVKKFTVIYSKKILLNEVENVYLESMIVQMDDIRKIIVYHSTYPLFDKISDYHADPYPNYESIYAVLTLEKEFNRVIPVYISGYEDSPKYIALTSNNRIKIIETGYEGKQIVRTSKPVLTSAFNKAGAIEKIRNFETSKSNGYLLLVKENDSEQLYFLQKKLLGWSVSAVKSDADVKSLKFEEIIPSQTDLE